MKKENERNFILLQFSCGLGNQMFQYAFYKKLLSLHRNVRCEFEYFKRSKTKYQIEDIFPRVQTNKASSHDIELYADNVFLKMLSNSQFIRIRRIYDIFTGKNYKMTMAHNATKYLPEYLKVNNGYLRGFWQNERYFKDIKEQIINDFQFEEIKDEKNTEVMDRILNTNSVSIHVRRGDYIFLSELPREISVDKIINRIIWKKPMQVVYYTCDLQYYHKAIDYVKDKVYNPNFFVFSDDITWCEKSLQLQNATYVSWNTGSESYRDMQLMSLCKHNIICNSTFGWWGGYLNQNNDKIVVAPENWFGFDGKLANSENIPESWITL